MINLFSFSDKIKEKSFDIIKKSNKFEIEYLDPSCLNIESALRVMSNEERFREEYIDKNIYKINSFCEKNLDGDYFEKDLKYVFSDKKIINSFVKAYTKKELFDPVSETIIERK
jgi:hypothetical protein